MSNFRQRMDESRGLARLDLVLKRAKLVNVFSGEIHETDIGIHQGQFVGIGTFENAEKVLDLDGNYIVPGLIDGHVHIESSHLCPEEFCSLLLSHGVTTAVVDPHEIANVLGVQGIRYILDSIQDLPFNGFVALPSCVPATELETSGARLRAADLKGFLDHPNVIGLGEVMDYPGVLAAKAEMVEKLELPVRFKDGHAPGISPQDLNAYYRAGIHTEHECSTVEEVRERLRRGFYVMLREGSAANNLRDLLPAVTPENSSQCLLVTDDRHPRDLIQEGSIDHLVRLAIQEGVNPIRVIQMATINTARAIGLLGLGAVAPGYQADFVILKDLNRFEIEEVYWRGKRLSCRGERPHFPKSSIMGMTESVHLENRSPNRLKLNITSAGALSARMRVIGVQGHSLVTSEIIRELPVVNHCVVADPAQKIAKIAVLERHHKTGNVGVGFVEGLGLTKGAIASTVAHDSHNLVVVGMSDEEMNLAIDTCAEMGGGLCLVRGDQVLGKLPLPIAGLMSNLDAELIAQTLSEIHAQARNLGIYETIDPFMTLAFLSLPVIPEIKLTDLGLVDVSKFQLTNVIL
ncbi:Adenine deaminase [Desulfosporosinus acidiphilus SJ4]|uniref:Adenine deaminase n=1 Tax=Desulfosporosinus acidiphilus (strain DSM 22704 / JCM 16185 / SJ4) TaxID=646529 RepID=I4D5G6_DESAJ|nr:adenine deaminase [Desulfosporosinus acidiphilus]AFM41040.1 Adenine deaminase [Desulfosporosinus acidiphilus SJ4]